MIKRKIPGDKCGCCCTLKEKLNTLWNRAIGCINKINEITPDGTGKFSLEAGDNVLLTEISNGMRISTTGGISYYSAGDSYIDVDNTLLQISLVNPGQAGGVALHDDLEVVAQSVSDIIDGTTQIADAAHADSATAADSATSATNAVNAQYLGSSSSNIGTDTKPVKIVNGQAVAVTNTLARGDVTGEQVTINGCVLNKVRIGNVLFISLQDGTPAAIGDYDVINNAVEGTQYGIVPIMTSGNVIVGYLFGQNNGRVTMRISQVLAGTGFHATYLINL